MKQERFFLKSNPMLLLSQPKLGERHAHILPTCLRFRSAVVKLCLWHGELGHKLRNSLLDLFQQLRYWSPPFVSSHGGRQLLPAAAACSLSPWRFGWWQLSTQLFHTLNRLSKVVLFGNTSRLPQLKPELELPVTHQSQSSHKSCTSNSTPRGSLLPQRKQISRSGWTMQLQAAFCELLHAHTAVSVHVLNGMAGESKFWNKVHPQKANL